MTPATTSTRLCAAISELKDGGPDAAGRAVRLLEEELAFRQRLAEQDQLAHAEQRLALAMRMGRLGSWELDLDTFELRCNAQCKANLGLPPDAPCSGHQLLDQIIHPEDRARVREILRHAIARQEEYDAEYRVLYPDNSVHWLMVRGRAIYDIDGRPLRMHGFSLDVTRRREAEELLRLGKSAAEAANAAKDHFLAMLSHELRTPLTPVLATAQILESDPTLASDHREMITTIRRNIELEARLIDDLLDLTRIARGKIDLHFAPGDLHDKIRHVVTICTPDAQAKRLDVELQLEATSCCISADSPRLHQVLWNLLKNAIKFTPPQGRITLRTSNLNGHVVLSVSDTGIGIEPQLLPRIFDAFEQGGANVTRKYGGLGLGLAISKGIVELHSGTLSAASPGRGQGATFTLCLPVAAPSLIPAPSLVPAAPHPLPASSLQAEDHPDTPAITGRRYRVLLVEDHADTARVMARLFRQQGHEVQVAHTLADALQKVEQHELDLIISDVGLPDGSGLELMQRIRQKVLLPGIALSGYGMEEDVRRSKEAGFASHLTKPVNLHALQEVIRQVMNA